MESEYTLEHFGFSANQISLERRSYVEKCLDMLLDTIIQRLVNSEETINLFAKEKDYVIKNVLKSMESHLSKIDDLDNKLFSVPGYVLLPRDWDHMKENTERDEEEQEQKVQELKQEFLQVENAKYDALKDIYADEIAAQDELKQMLHSYNNKISAHSLLAALAVREDLGTNAQAFSRKHPLACWLSTMLVIFSGAMVANALLGEPILAPLKNTPQLLVGTAVWYMVFYTPFDIGYKIGKFLPVKLVASAMKEIYRAKKVYDGVTHAAKLYPNAWIIMIIIGTIKGNGAGFTKLLERLIRGAWTPTAMEFMQPSFYTKASLLASIIFVLDKKTDWMSAPHALVYFGIVIFLVYFKLSSILLGIHDPFLPFENLFCAIFFGGIWDSLAKILGRGQIKEGEGKDAKKSN
uniref:Uncharacterized protein n=1 Tax=Glossina morsitans morsitans TaxID=37546 RepID=A0A1B0G4V0_GLOMM